MGALITWLFFTRYDSYLSWEPDLDFLLLVFWPFFSIVGLAIISLCFFIDIGGISSIEKLRNKIRKVKR